MEPFQYDDSVKITYEQVFKIAWNKRKEKKIWKWCIDLIWLIGCEMLHLRFCTAESIPSKCSHKKNGDQVFRVKANGIEQILECFGFILFPTLSNFVYLGENLIEKIVGWLMELN